MVANSPETRRANIRTVAEHAGVSKSLVSLAFQSPEKVSPARLRRIMESAEELGYSPNWVARSLAARRSGFVAILVADLGNPFHIAVAESVRATLDENEVHGLLSSAAMRGSDGGLRHDSRVMDMIRDLRPSGIVVVGSLPDEAVQATVPDGTPVAFASGAGPAGLRATTVMSDDAAGIGLVVDHLTGLGHTEIAFVGGDATFVGRRRSEAFVSRLRAKGLEGRLAIGNDFSESAGYETGRALLESDRTLTAVVAVNDLGALGVMGAAAELGLDVPGDLSVTGYDNTFVARLDRVALTTIDPGAEETGRRAALAVLRSLDSGAAEAPEVIAVEPELVVRRSTAAPPAGS